MTRSPSISVILPVYNASPYLRECLESIFSQSFADFELLVADDGSTDGSVDVARSYSDARLRLIERPHNYIGTLNCLLAEARGRYVARMDADDVMAPERLQRQWDYMEAHPEVDVWAGAMSFIGAEGQTFAPPQPGRPLELRDFLGNNLFGNPATIMRTATLRRLGAAYEEAYKYAEDYRFWTRLVHAGVRIECTPQVFAAFRRSEGQTTQRHNAEAWAANRRVKDELETWISDRDNAGYVEPVVRPSSRRLTVIIPFLNEGEEVVATVGSIRQTVGSEVDILVINDQSTDGYPYAASLAPYDVYYFVNHRRLGVAASRDRGVSLIQTPYFLLLDGHMRFYDAHWAQRIADCLDADDRCLLCCQGRYLQKVNGQVSDLPRAYASYGAYCPFIKGKSLASVVWKNSEYAPSDKIEPIPVVLGAGYAASRRYWQYLHGLEGLRYYGSDEAYISLKVWREGGRCLLLKDVVAGHIYRKSSPFRRFSADEAFNNLLVAYLLLPQTWRAVGLAGLYLNYPPEQRASALSLFEAGRSRWEELRRYYRSIFTVTFAGVLRCHRRLCHREIAEKMPKIDRWIAVAAFVKSHPATDDGLMDGRMGQMIWACHYHRKSGCAEWEEIAYHLWDAVEEAVRQRRLPLNFRYGLHGVGWGLLYLYENGFIDDDIDPILQQIDLQLAAYDAAADPDLGLDTGVAGALAYAVARMRAAGRAGRQLDWPKARFEALTAGARRVLAAPPDLVSATYALQWLIIMREGIDRDDLPLALNDWMQLSSRHIPIDTEFWSNALTGNVLTATLYAMVLAEYNKSGRNE